MAPLSVYASTASFGLDRRTARRFRVFKGAVLNFNRGYGAFECIVRDMTDKGALLEVGDLAGVPTHFTMHVNGEDETRAARTMWRGNGVVGVAFA